MTKAAIGIGSNRGDRLDNIRKSVQLMRAHVGEVILCSDVYETPPWGVVEQPLFLNACTLVETMLSPHELLGALKRIESTLGRVARERWGPREIDLDILFYDDLVVSDDILTIPHALMTERAFVLLPLAQIAPNWRHPLANATTAELLAGMDTSEHSAVRIVAL